MNSLDKLAAKHSYFCFGHYRNNSILGMTYKTWAEFTEEWEDADLDMNHVFRFDIKKHDDSEQYYMEVFIILQRKGRLISILIEEVTESDAKSIESYLIPHFEKTLHLWEPFSKKRYLLFEGQDYYPDEAWSNFKGFFDSIEEAKQAVEDKDAFEKECKGCASWVEIVDTFTEKIVWENKIE